MTRFIALLTVWLGMAIPAFAQFGGGEPRATVDSAISTDAVHAGEKGVMAVVVDVADTFHAQSHKPLDANLIAFNVTTEPTEGVTWSAPVYPEGKTETYGGQKLSVYTGKVVVYVPFTVKSGATGPLELKAKVRYQICDDKGSCFAPEEPGVRQTAKVVPASQELKPNRPELFEKYKPGARGSENPPQPEQKDDHKAALPPSELSGPSAASHSIGWAVAAAFGVGLLFNIMPCVLPVLPIKAIGFFEAAQHDRRRAVMLGLAFSLGVVLFFGLLSLPVLVFKWITWGEPFSHPAFIWGISGLMLIMALGMFGLFDVRLPTSVYNVTPRHDTYMGNFLFGLFTALLATPCTAPLLPELLLWAGSKPAAIAILIMVDVGVGMAAPYLVLSAMPELARKFPRTGPWSELVKQMMGFLLIAAAVYFAAGSVIHGPGFWWAVVAVVAVACLYLLGRTVQLSKSAVAMAVSAMLAVSMFGGVLTWAVRVNGVFAPQQATWVPFSQQAFDQARGEGKVVLVKFTANWCATCQAIEATVFADSDVWKSMHDHGVVTLKADMTGDNPEAKALLTKLNPTGGIPLTAIYSPTWSEPLKLESQYTSGTLLRAIDAAAKKGQGEGLASAR